MIKNLKAAAVRIKKAIKKKENIILYGDADFDGVSSVIIIKEAIRNLGGKVDDIYFPDRETEGYGVNEEALQYLKNKVPALMIVMDCGIGNFEELKQAKKMGLEVIIADHHKILKKLPTASIIINPKQKDDKYPFKDFAAAGVVFKLAEALLGKKMTPALRKDLLELAAIATIADMMPQEEDNLDIIIEGLNALKSTERPALRVFWDLTPFDKEEVRQMAQKVISASHAGGTKNHLNEAYLLLTASSKERAKVLAEELIEKSKFRQSLIQDITQEIEDRASRKTKDHIIFEGSAEWPVLMLGPAASRVCNSQKKPVFLYSKKDKDSQGAVRTPKDIDGVKALMHCSKFLRTYGGHAQAAGFRVDNDNIGDFHDCLMQYFS